MDCPRCGQSNLPGSAACFGCGALLEAPRAPEPTYPPRAERSGWREGLARQRPDRRSRFFWNRLPVRDLLLPYLGRGFASLLPGLGQWLNRQWLKGLAFALAAAALMTLLLSGYLDVNLEFALALWLSLTLAGVFDAAWHAMPPELRDSLTWRHRFGLGAVMASVILTASSLAFLLINHYCLFFRLNADLPPLALKRQETLLAWRYPSRDDWPGRGDMVVLGTRNQLLGVLVGLPDDRVSLGDGQLRVNGRSLPPKLLPNLDRGRKQELVPGDGEAAVLVYQMPAGGRWTPQVRLVRRSGTVYRIMGVILPFGHRRSLGGVF